MPKREPSETMCTHCGEVRAFALRGCSRRRLSFSRGAPPHFLLIKCPPFLPPVSIPHPRLPGLASSLRVPPLRQAPSLPFASYRFLSVLFHAVAILFSMAKLNSARNFFERARMMTVGSFSVSQPMRVITARDLLFKENHDLFQQNNESTTRASRNSTMVGKGKVMSHEDIVQAQRK
jgi:hypothetical protein